MLAALSRSVSVPAEIEPLVAAVKTEVAPSAVWLFGSRARGDGGPDSDWDVLVAVPDDCEPDVLDPVVAWSLIARVGIKATLIVVRQSELDDAWGVPNTIAFDLARHGKRLDV